jgi:hypothetical protein
VRVAEKEVDAAVFGADARMMLQLLEGMACLRKENFTRAKFIFSEAIGQLTQRMHQEQSKSKRLTIQTASFFTVATYFLA